MRKVVTIVGARPQFVKAAIVSRALKATGHVSEFVVHTGQHYDRRMSDIFFEELDMAQPDVNLNVGSASHGRQTGIMLQEIEVVLLEQQPDVVLVFGDTNSTLAGALAAAKLQIPLAHVEAGLRSFNRRMPEEINRVVCDSLSQLLFAPTQNAAVNLKRDGVPQQKIHVVGDVMYDATLAFAKIAEKRKKILEELRLFKGEYVLATVHRAENTDDPRRLQAIFSALSSITSTTQIVMPMHPRTRAALNKNGLSNVAIEKLKIIDPVGYLDMVQLTRNARTVVTDSGGLQKEAFFFGVPCVTLREETEWTETVETGANRLVGAKTDRIVDAISSCIRVSAPLPNAGPYYGNGSASKRIAEILVAAELSV